jgi:hypothetical protein
MRIHFYSFIFATLLCGSPIVLVRAASTYDGSMLIINLSDRIIQGKTGKLLPGRNTICKFYYDRETNKLTWQFSASRTGDDTTGPAETYPSFIFKKKSDNPEEPHNQHILVVVIFISNEKIECFSVPYYYTTQEDLSPEELCKRLGLNLRYGAWDFESTTKTEQDYITDMVKTKIDEVFAKLNTKLVTDERTS